ncbi:MAG: hypothetical protein M1827_006729 [Pycnora praestabilis]|nr:MAG: hypothetical protein M1827_006729 [Pycnora praestabilis]
MGREDLTTPQRPIDELHIPTKFFNRRIEGPKKSKEVRLSAGDYRRLSKKLDEQDALEPNDADCTKVNIHGIRIKWTKFILENYRVPKVSSIRQYWRQFKMLFSRCTGYEMNTNAAREVHKEKYRLDMSVKSKPVMGVDDLLLVLTHHWAKDKSVFPNERQRVQLPMILLFAAYTASRPGELVDAMLSQENKRRIKEMNQQWKEPWDNPENSDYDEIGADRGKEKETERSKAVCYEDIRLMLLRNPTPGERHVLAMEITLAHHKGVDRRLKPTTFLFREEDDPIFCPITHILTLAFVDHAFEAPSLRSVEQIFGLRILKPVNCIQLHWKESMKKIPVFRQAVRAANGFKTSPNKALRYSTFDHYLERLGYATGFEEKLASYCVRRGTGNAVDGTATKAVRDQVMRHDSNSNIFQAYLNQRVKFDVQAAFLERPSADGLLRAFAHMSLTCDPRAPTSVPQDLLNSLPFDSTLSELQQQRKLLRARIRAEHIAITRAKGTMMEKEYQQIVAAINSKKIKHRKAALKKYRRDYFHRRHTEEIERQLNGITEEEYVEPSIHHQLQEREQLQQILCSFPTSLSNQDILSRRIHAVKLMTALSRRQEVQRRRRQRTTRVQEFSEDEEAAKLDSFPLICKKTQCPICIGNESMTYSERTFSYCRPAKMMDHVESHLRAISVEQNVVCHHPVCKLKGVALENIGHFKNHVQRVHGISLRI